MSDHAPPSRPVAPHLQIWRWHITLAASIGHRLSGIALYAGLLILTGWVFALDAGPDAYAAYAGAIASPIGLVVLFVITLAVFFHLANGLRHLFWDVGKGFALKTANATAVWAFVFAAAATAALWLALFAWGGL
jgi:succinate dehydrogenase / fumarate reductase cytochrome b subunit